MMRTTKIHFTGKDLGDIFKAVQVKCVLKDEQDNPVLILRSQYVAVGSPTVCLYGDYIEQTDNTWRVIKTDKVRL